MNYLLCTNIYNEKNQIEKTFKMVTGFILQPRKWLIIVDGATDGSEHEVERCAGIYDINVQCYILPPKQKGSLRTLGKAYNAAFDELKIRDEDYDFMCVMDVDNIFHSDYTKVAATTFESSGIGVISPPNPLVTLKMPQGNGKCVRWDVIQYITEFWEPAIDTFLNIKAKKLGYSWYIMNNKYGIVEGPAGARNRTAGGAHHAGWLHSYTSGSFWGAIKRVIYRIFKLRYGLSFWRGFMENERCVEGPRRTYDEDVMRYYGRIKNGKRVRD